MTLKVKNEIHLFIVKTNIDFLLHKHSVLGYIWDISFLTNEIFIFILIINGTRKGLIIHVKKVKTVVKHTLLSYDLCDTLCTQKSRLCRRAD